eukprot:NODE_1429_length_1166_cov_113.786034_g1173_i0.p1 GENE.NODE_1429_length_1166_cov_113.786034_g1173_i0~~NODE_1429_length_1166_cov_113.786034_g1173_i0.p1  ORF type:complete len:273 (-),score=47.36 NODE_1429_length_1166_cov_113.786034_g1173_i0:90-908(-)
MFVFGGFRNNGAGLDDTFALDLESRTWRRLNFAESSIPHRRGGHTASLYKNLMLVFGGSHKDSMVSQLDLVSCEWSTLKCHGSVPQGRLYHTAAVHQDSLFLYGGCWGSRWEQQNATSYDDMFELNLLTSTWRQLACAGPKPSGMSRHAADVHDGQMILFGGKCDRHLVNDVHTLDLETKRWSRHLIQGNIPHPRYRHTCTVFQNYLYLFGGKDEANYFNDLHVLDLRAISLKFFVGIWLVSNKVNLFNQGLPEALLQWLQQIRLPRDNNPQ